MTPADGNHLERILAAATVALEHGRMQVELQLQLTELRTSRARIVEAADAERRRLERDLHDGIQAQLVALGLNVRTRQRRLGEPVSPAVTTLIDETIVGIQDAISALRDVARGVLSPLLVSDGLPGAIADLVRRLPVPVTLEVSVPERLHPQVESTAWYVTCEALTNALKHAPGAPTKVSIGRDADNLHVVVSDEGPGGADPGRGSGLRGLTDRVEAVGGRLSVISNVHAGTVVEAILPCV
jgi:signal transduction histidine kinase